MWWVCIVSDTKILPPRDIIPGDIGIVGCIFGITRQVGDHTHCTNADDAFEGEVCLITASTVLARLQSQRLGRLTRVHRQSHL